MKKQQKCYIYTRDSTSMQVEGYSLDAQKDKLKKYADYQEMSIVGEYSDEGKSGKSVEGRPQFKQMLADVESGKDNVDYVLVFKLSRFGRNAADVLSSLQKMQDYGVKKRVCAYARVSTDSRRQEDSLENQMETYERMITGNPEYEFIGVFADQGISGYCENRPQFQRMMEKARAGEIDLIITKSISRFARNTVTVLKFARELKELGVGIFLKNRTLTLYQGTVRLCLPSSLLLHRKKAEA